VYGSPPAWPALLIPDQGTRNVDNNAARCRTSPTAPALRAFMAINPCMKLDKPSVFAGRSSPSFLVNIAFGEGSALDCTAEVVGSTVILVRRDLAVVKKITAFIGCRADFESKYF
jgi:hypothetical protein